MKLDEIGELCKVSDGYGCSRWEFAKGDHAERDPYISPYREFA